MDNQIAVILGGVPLNIGVVDKFKSMGYFTVVVDFREKINLVCDEHIVFDAKNPEITQVLRQRGYQNIRVVYTSMDNAGLAQKAICQEYGLLYSDEDSLLRAHKKDLMQAAWQKDGLLNRESFAVNEFDLEKIMYLNNEFKIIFKPADSCASRGITVVDKRSGEKVLKEAFDLAKSFSTSGLVNIEEFIDGQEYTVEMIGDNSGNVCVFGVSKKYHTENTQNNKIAVKLHYNAQDVSLDFQKEISEFGIACYKSLGLKNVLGHLEVLCKLDGTFSPVEIGSRSSCFIASHLLDAVSGNDYLQTLIDVQNGSKVSNGLLAQTNFSSMYYFYDIPSNSKSKKKLSLEGFLNPLITSLYSDRKALVEDREFLPLTQDTDRYGYEVLVGPKDSLTMGEVQRAEKAFLKEFLV